MQLRRNFIFLFGYLIAYAPLSRAAPALLLEDSTELQDVQATPYLEVWEDESKQETIQGLLNAPKPFQDFNDQDIKGAGYSKSIYWGRFRVLNQTDKERIIYLEATDPQQYLNFYAIDQLGQNITDQQEVGAFRPISNQRLLYRFPVLEIKAKPGLNTYYFRLDVVSVTFPYHFWTKDQLLEKSSTDQVILSFLFGSFCVVALYNLLLALTTLRREYFLYFGYLASFIYLQLFLTGTGHLVFGDSWAPMNQGWAVAVALITGFTIHFSISFLDLKSESMHTVWRILIFYSFLTFAFGLISFWDKQYAMRFFLFVLTAFFFIIYAGSKRALEGFRPAILYMIGWVCLVLGTTFLLSYYMGYFNRNQFANWSMLAGASLQMIFFSLAIGERIRYQIEDNLKEQAILFDRHRQEVESREHAYQQLGKVFYPHQLRKMERGIDLESTMPTGPSQACVIQLDIINSSKINISNRKDFLVGFFKSCHELMMHNYDSETMTADAYRIKEVGDGFLCSIGYPFRIPEHTNNAAHAIDLAEKFIEVLRRNAESLHYPGPIHCSIGIAIGEIEGFFPHTGTKEYDLYGQGIILANRYESLRKSMFKVIDFDVIIIQDEVYKRLPSDMHSKFIAFDLEGAGIQVRDDPDARLVYYRAIKGCSSVAREAV